MVFDPANLYDGQAGFSHAYDKMALWISATLKDDQIMFTPSFMACHIAELHLSVQITKANPNSPLLLLLHFVPNE